MTGMRHWYLILGLEISYLEFLVKGCSFLKRSSNSKEFFMPMNLQKQRKWRSLSFAQIYWLLSQCFGSWVRIWEIYWFTGKSESVRLPQSSSLTICLKLSTNLFINLLRIRLKSWRISFSEPTDWSWIFLNCFIGAWISTIIKNRWKLWSLLKQRSYQSNKESNYQR
jgi:hypothetical protein